MKHMTLLTLFLSSIFATQDTHIEKRPQLKRNKTYNPLQEKVFLCADIPWTLLTCSYRSKIKVDKNSKYGYAHKASVGSCVFIALDRKNIFLSYQSLRFSTPKESRSFYHGPQILGLWIESLPNKDGWYPKHEETIGYILGGGYSYGIEFNRKKSHIYFIEGSCNLCAFKDADEREVLPVCIPSIKVGFKI